LPWKAAELAGARLPVKPEEQWLRYYGQRDWDVMSYHLALSNSPAYFRDKIVFIGQKPQSALPDTEEDKFNTPYSRWSEGSVGGVELLATAFLNLMNGDWLRRPEWRLEALVLCATGLCLGGGLCQVRLPANRSSTSCPTPRARRRSRPARGRPEPHSNAWCGTPSPQYAVGRAVHSVRTYRNLYTAHHTWVNSVFLVDPLTGWMEFTGTRY